MEGQKLEVRLKMALQWSATAVCFAIVLILPVMSAYAEGELVSGEIIVRGLSLLTFSPFGMLAILFFLLSVRTSRATHMGKRALSLLMLYSVAIMVCLGCTLSAAYHWLHENVAAQISWKYGLPVLIIVAILPVLVKVLVLSRTNLH